MPSRFLPASLAGRFALAAAGIAAAALLATSLTAWSLINRQHQRALEELWANERTFHAVALGSELAALQSRMADVATSTILATGLVDSAGRETYLGPFLAGMRQVNGVPVQVLFTDFEGQEIASNGVGSFSEAQLEWLRRELAAGRANATIFSEGGREELVALEPLTYARTSSPEGALFYKIDLGDLHTTEGLRLEWGRGSTTVNAHGGDATHIPVPAVYKPLALRLTALQASPPSANLAPEYVTILAVALALFTAVVVAGVALARLLTRDVKRLETFSSSVVQSGLGNERAPARGSAEVASLALSINRMLDALHESDRRKDEFLAMLAHELRNPLAPIMSSLDLMKRAPGEEKLMAQARGVAERQARHLVRLVDDLLDVSRITRGRLELRTERIALGAIVDQALEASRAEIESARHELVLGQPAKALFVDADPVRLVQVLCNLLNNAAKYTPPGGRITVEVEAEGGEVHVRVRDTGIGIEPAMLEHVFELFVRADHSLQRMQGGLGIGLTLARRLVELHGGRLEARSEGPGRGSEFTVRLALAAGNQPQSAGAPEVSALSSCRLLVVDDNVDAAESLALLLRHAGADARVAYDGEQALALAREFRPQAILLDIGLPGMTGYDVCRALRSLPGGEAVFVVALTGWGQETDRRRSREAGFDAHLVKPVDFTELLRLLESRPNALTSAGILSASK